jgi:hypothetical protein
VKPAKACFAAADLLRGPQDSRNIRACTVAQICILLYRRFVTCMAPRQLHSDRKDLAACRMHFGDTAESNSALNEASSIQSATQFSGDEKR